MIYLSKNGTVETKTGVNKKFINVATLDFTGVAIILLKLLALNAKEC